MTKDASIFRLELPPCQKNKNWLAVIMFRCKIEMPQQHFYFFQNKNMFDHQSGSDSSSSAAGQGTSYIRTMEKDLESPAVSFPQPANKVEIPRPSENHPAEPQTPPAPSPQTPVPAPVMDSSSPFSKTYFEKEGLAAPAAPLPPKNAAANIPLGSPLQPLAEKTAIAPQKSVPAASRHPLRKIIISFVSVVAVLLLMAGGYLYWKSRSSAQPAAAPAPTQQNVAPQPSPEPVQINPLSAKYSTQNPNYFTVDADTATPDSIHAALASTAAEIGQSGLTSPIEFVVTDSNNNPIAFHIFCALAKINLPPALLSALGDNFSLYFYSDAGTVRLGLAVDSKDKAVTALQMKAIESKAMTILSPILLTDVASVQPSVFKDSTYNGFSIRYVNLDPNTPLSIDYTLNDKTLFIGTSKSTLRAILDKASQNNPPAAQTSTSTSPAADTNSTPVPDATANTAAPANAPGN